MPFAYKPSNTQHFNCIALRLARCNTPKSDQVVRHLGQGIRCGLRQSYRVETYTQQLSEEGSHSLLHAIVRDLPRMRLLRHSVVPHSLDLRSDIGYHCGHTEASHAGSPAARLDFWLCVHWIGNACCSLNRVVVVCTKTGTRRKSQMWWYGHLRRSDLFLNVRAVKERHV